MIEKYSPFSSDLLSYNFQGTTGFFIVAFSEILQLCSVFFITVLFIIFLFSVCVIPWYYFAAISTALAHLC